MHKAQLYAARVGAHYKRFRSELFWVVMVMNFVMASINMAVNRFSNYIIDGLVVSSGKFRKITMECLAYANIKCAREGFLRFEIEFETCLKIIINCFLEGAIKFGDRISFVCDKVIDMKYFSAQ